MRKLLSDDLIAKVKTIMIGTRTAETAISRRILVTIGDGVVKPIISVLLKENGGLLQLTEDWARGVLKFMN